METKEYRTIDKSSWARGEWDQEPDKRQWRDEATGLPCLIVRNSAGALCGYVGVSTDHPLHGKDWDDKSGLPVPVLRKLLEDRGVAELYVDELRDGTLQVDAILPGHGGITFAGGCGHGEESTGICHVPGAGERDNVHWFGFDCAHAGDLLPHARYQPSQREKYRSVDYVTRKCRALALALKGIGEG